ncbi:hypothetical protein ACNKHU_04725 [Shigella flexneri]
MNKVRLVSNSLLPHWQYDFDGLTHEQLRQRLINGAPKYGNDGMILSIRCWLALIRPRSNELSSTIIRATVVVRLAATYHAGTLTDFRQRTVWRADDGDIGTGAKPTPPWQKRKAAVFRHGRSWP